MELEGREDASIPRELMDNIRHNFKSSMNFNQKLNTIFQTPQHQKVLVKQAFKSQIQTHKNILINPNIEDLQVKELKID